MEDFKIKCPLCCDETFGSAKLLIEHLTNVTENLHCSVCSTKCLTVSDLIRHLTNSHCTDITNQDLVFVNDSNTNIDEHQNITPLQNNEIKGTSHVDLDSAAVCSSVTLESESGNADDKMYVELIEKQLVKVDANGQFVIVAQDHGKINLEGTIVTKQNNDGTISLSTIEEMKSETVISPTEAVPEDTQQCIYSCNTCGVSFTSVLEHIQTYHDNQDVVVEELEPLEDEETTIQEDTKPRRMITETGDIVVSPLITKTEGNVHMSTGQEVTLDSTSNKEEHVLSNSSIVCDSIVKNISKGDEVIYHKVVMKEKLENGIIEMSYKCVSCNRSVTELNDFKNYPCKILKYSCPHCSVAYDNSKSLCAHLKVHKGKSENPTIQDLVVFECELCGTVFPTNKSLKLHKRMHDPLKSRPPDRPVGSSDTSTYWKCCQCDKSIPIEYKTIHENFHKGNDALNCGICNKKFTSYEYLEMHSKVHNIDKVVVNKPNKLLPYKCLYCNRKFARPHEKVKHERIHTGEKPHSCEICGKSFRVSYCLTLHMRTHTGARPYACQHCGKRFKAHSVYNHHLQTHSDVRAYKCPFCPKAFKTSVQLAGHKNSHTKPFSCQQCNRPFASLYAVRVHTETHSRQNNLKFSCVMCGASYARAFALKDHIKQAHKKTYDSVNDMEADVAWAMKNTETHLDPEKREVMVLEMDGTETIVP